MRAAHTELGIAPAPVGYSTNQESSMRAKIDLQISLEHVKSMCAALKGGRTTHPLVAAAKVLIDAMNAPHNLSADALQPDLLAFERMLSKLLRALIAANDMLQKEQLSETSYRASRRTH
jgi:hypothetical protein